MSKNHFFLFYILFSLKGICLYAESKHLVDVSYLVADFKYSQKQGLKICEVQHGSLSAIAGDLYLSGEDGTIAPLIGDFFALFPMRKWAAGLIYPPLKRSLVAREWEIQPSIKTVLKDPAFLTLAARLPANPVSIDSYAGIIYADFEIARTFKASCNPYPGILFVNAATFPYWRDKYKMNALFELSDELKQYKADWRLYPKQYDSLLSERIKEEMPSDFYVIKPRSEFLANGVIVVDSRDLDTTLELILKPLAALEKHPDKKYAYWSKNRDDSFLIEKYYESDYLRFHRPLSEKIALKTECHYDATMRIAFILQYDEGKMTYHSLGGFWKLPSKALEEEASLNEKRISCCKPPFYTAVDPELLEEVNVQMERAMLLLYEMMLSPASL